MRTRRLVVGLVVLALVATLAGIVELVGVRRSADEGAPPDWVRPPGHWNRLPMSDPAGDPAGDTGEDLAQLLSLPYSAGGAAAPAEHGVVHHDEALAHPGVNLYVSGHAPEVILITMDGAFLHRWRRDFTDVFPDRAAGPETDFIRRARLLDDCSLLVLYQGGGLARLDASSRVLWATPGAFFNDFDVVGEQLFVLGKRARRLPAVRPDGAVLEDFVAVHDLATGERLRQAPILPAFRRGGYGALLDPLPETADIFHSNTILVLGDPVFADTPFSGFAGFSSVSENEAHDDAHQQIRRAFAPGNLLLSLREIDTLAVLDSALDTVLWAHRGPWRAQHEPVPVAGERLLLFDNRGGSGGHSRVLLWDLVAERIAGSLEHPRIDSPQAGTVAPLGDGHLVVTASEQGRALELDAEGRVVWELVSPHRAGADGELVATLFELQRLPMIRCGSLNERH